MERLRHPNRLHQHLEPAEGASAQVEATRLRADARCPYCREDMPGGSLASACKGCGTLHHVSCFAENVGCTVHGCGARGAKAVRIGSTLPPHTRTRPCSHCKEPLNAGGLVARCACTRVSHPRCYEVLGRCPASCAGDVELLTYAHLLASAHRTGATAWAVLGWSLMALSVGAVCLALFVARRPHMPGILAVFFAGLAIGPLFGAWWERARARALEEEERADVVSPDVLKPSA